MVHIKVTKGLNVPIAGKPEGSVKPLIPGGEVSPLKTPHQIALDLNSYDEVKFRLHTKVGESVKLGQPLVEDKSQPGLMFVSPAGGVIKEVRRGLKRRLLDIVIEVHDQEEAEQFDPFNIAQVSREELVEFLKARGLLIGIRQRPFNLLVNIAKVPRSIFVKALESAPLVPPAELQVAGYEKEFQAGLDVLAKLTPGDVNLVYWKDTNSRAFLDAKGVKKHTVEGPHPSGNYSLHIQYIDPIRSPEDVIWTINAHDVMAIGSTLLKGRYFVDRVISIAGPGILEDQTGYFRVRQGYPIAPLIAGRIRKGLMRLVAGDVLTGKKVDTEDFLGFYDYSLSVVPENLSRQFLHFLRLGTDKYTHSGAYISGHLGQSQQEYNFTTNQHGEHRPFIDSTLYDDVMPLNIPTMHLLKAILAEDYDLAVDLGLMEVDSEDFALPAFVCPSKIEMPEIVRKGLRRYAEDILK